MFKKKLLCHKRLVDISDMILPQYRIERQQCSAQREGESLLAWGPGLKKWCLQVLRRITLKFLTTQTEPLSWQRLWHISSLKNNPSWRPWIVGQGRRIRESTADEKTWRGSVFPSNTLLRKTALQQKKKLTFPDLNLFPARYSWEPF